MFKNCYFSDKGSKTNIKNIFISIDHWFMYRIANDLQYSHWVIAVWTLGFGISLMLTGKIITMHNMNLSSPDKIILAHVLGYIIFTSFASFVFMLSITVKEYVQSLNTPASRIWIVLKCLPVSLLLTILIGSPILFCLFYIIKHTVLFVKNIALIVYKIPGQFIKIMQYLWKLVFDPIKPGKGFFEVNGYNPLDIEIEIEIK